MITAGFIQELFYIAKVKNQDVSCDLFVGRVLEPIKIKISPDSTLIINYKNEKIWQEKVSGPSSMWGIESAHSIYNCLQYLDNNDPSWRKFVYIQNS